jgi:hypothetical protein
MQVPSAYLPPEPSQVAAVLAQLESGRASAAIVMLKRRAAETTRSSCFSIIVRLGGVERLTEPEWPGGCLRIGKTVIGVQDLRLRCIMTSYNPTRKSKTRKSRTVLTQGHTFKSTRRRRPNGVQVWLARKKDKDHYRATIDPRVAAADSGWRLRYPDTSASHN